MYSTIFLIGLRIFSWDQYLNSAELFFFPHFSTPLLISARTGQADGALAGLKNIWVLFRDLVNVVIVILFILSSVLMVFSESAFSVNRSKTLIALIGAAVFVNFSGFLAFFLIDLSHVLLIIFGNHVLDANSFAGIEVFDEEINLSIGLSTTAAVGELALIYAFSKIIIYLFPFTWVSCFHRPSH